jgi:two-component system, OmpR family, phosphate regulon sensor histidine kinase PhoR
MTTSTLNILSNLIRGDSELILREWTLRVLRIPSAREVDRPTLLDHMPMLIEELSTKLKRQEETAIDPADSNHCSEAHGTLRFQEGFDVVEVVAEYNVLREVLYDFAEQRGILLTGRAAGLVNRTIDHAIAFAVKAHATEKTLELQRRREEHFSFLVHDLKTPLAAIETAMMIVDAKYRDPLSPSTRLLDVVRRNARRLNAVVSKLLQDQANLQTQAAQLEKREFDLWPLVEDLIRDLRPLADTAATVIINEVPEELSMYADAHAISRVFQNLVSNAINYTQHGHIIIGARQLGSAIECWVEDSGQGIPQDRIEKIFEKLETDANREGGLGLGLAIVKEIVERHNGSVSVQSAVAKGSKFSFSIPLQ